MKHLTGGYASCDKIYYTFKYTFKQQESIDSRAAATLITFNNRLQKEQIDDTDVITDEILARRRIAALAISGSNKQEIALPLCALYLRRQTSARFSHEFVNLYLGQYINIFTQTTYTTMLTCTNRNMLQIIFII